MPSVTISLPSRPLRASSTCHPSDPIPEDPQMARERPSRTSFSSISPVTSSADAASIHRENDFSNSEYEYSTPETSSDESAVADLDPENVSKTQRARRASTLLVSQNSAEVRQFLGAESASVCCGGGCCKIKQLKFAPSDALHVPVSVTENEAYRSLNVKLAGLGHESQLTDLSEIPEQTIFFERAGQEMVQTHQSTRLPAQFAKHPPSFVKPHPPYDVYSAPLHHARELTKPGAEKRTFHFDIDVTEYPTESGDVDFRVGGAVGVCAPNSPEIVENVFNVLGIPKQVRDKPVLMKTTKGRWPTIWGDDEAREIVTTRRDLLTWCSDLQSYPPTKQLFRLMAEHSTDDNERKALLYLCSGQGQAAFCDLRTGPYVTILQILSAFPLSQPPLDHLLSVLQTLMPRFYSLSQDPIVSHERSGGSRRLIEVAVTVHEMVDWQSPIVQRTGVGSGFMERLALKFIQAEREGIDPQSLDLRVPMFRGLMANPLAKEFVTDGPMLLIGAGVGVAPFRGFVHRRLKSANCANKVWVLQGIRDSLVDELYSGDWGVHESKVKTVVQSRKASGRYVQDEVRNQADLVWFVINALDGRVFVCGSSQGMGEGVHQALVEVVAAKANLNEDEANEFWETKKKAGQYIAETW